MDLDATGSWMALDRRVIDLDHAVGWVVTSVVSFAILVAVSIAWLLPGPPAWLRYLMIPGAFVVAGSVGWVSYRWPYVEYRWTAYRVLPDRLEIRQGVVWRTLIAVPRSRVQHIDVSQGPFERRYGLATVTVYTAGTEYSRVNLRGLEHGLALGVRDGLLPADTPDGI